MSDQPKPRARKSPPSDSVRLPLDQVLHGDCIEILRRLPDKCVDLVFADPPYNLQLRADLWRPDMSKVEAVTEAWDQFSSLAAYDAFTREWLTECRRVLKDTGALWTIGSYHNIFRIGTILQDLQYWILNDVSWIKANPLPQMRGTRFCNAHETLIWAKKSEKQKKYTFHYHALKAGNEDRQMRSDWYLPICTGGERETRNGRKAHPTQKPESLLRRVIGATSNPGDVILDPFCGTGTTAAVAKSLGRHYITIDREEAYVGLAEKRLASVSPALLEEQFTLPESRTPRIPFVSFVESARISAGTVLRLKGTTVTARVYSDGTIGVGDVRGSIHKIGAYCLAVPTCNGWLSWLYIDRETGEERPLDVLRHQSAE